MASHTTPEQKRAWRKTNPTASARHQREYRERHPERAKQQQWRQDLRRYGLTPETFGDLLIAQSGLCACCEDQLLRPHVDHDHETKRVRGLLCNWCNLMVGHAREDPGRLAAGIRYLLGTPMRLDVVP
jgi:hypothetical protein